MITEDYVSFETAKLLKEKGFNEKCGPYYELSGILINCVIIEAKHNIDGDKFSAPTLQMAMKWLREEHNLFIEFQCYGANCYENAHFEYSYVIKEYVAYNHEKTVGLEHKHSKSMFNSYESACEAAIKYCLENLV